MLKWDFRRARASSVGVDIFWGGGRVLVCWWVLVGVSERDGVFMGEGGFLVVQGR